MKKVRFQSVHNNRSFNEMQDMDCHFPRPFIAKEEDSEASSSSRQELCSKIFQLKLDPLKVYENSNSSPYSMTHKTKLNQTSFPEARIEPSNDLELSMLDSHSQEPRKPHFCRDVILPPVKNAINSSYLIENSQLPKSSVLTSLNNVEINRPESNTAKDDSFFMKHNVNTKLCMDKENNPFIMKANTMQKTATKSFPSNDYKSNGNHKDISQINQQQLCYCHHCNVETKKNIMQCHNFYPNKQIAQVSIKENIPKQCPCEVNYCMSCVCEAHSMKNLCHHTANQPLETVCLKTTSYTSVPQNALEKKITAIQNYEQAKKADCTDVEKISAVAKEKREPTVGDLFKIIKLQNEQLQLLQEKVDKFISVSNNPQPSFPVQNYVTEQIALETVNNDHHKISIGVMTSFEMFRTSTKINKEVVKQTISNNYQNAQVQCNRSQISIKEVVIREPVNQNFLDGIKKKNTNTGTDDNLSISVHEAENSKSNNIQSENMFEERPFNDMSLCDVQVDNATTPLISPEQSMYLDVRDYSDSESGSDDQSNVGWTYYNKVMTHVNGMLQDSDMPSSASALYRNTRQQCVQMQIDKTNISVTKRVKFGDDPLGLHQPHLYSAPLTDTSMKMNQLAAKYLKTATQKPMTAPSVGNVIVNNEMSFATRNYMERHQLLQASRTPKPEMPRFLDITALKQQQQHKLL